jgi:hypothetical protein
MEQKGLVPQEIIESKILLLRGKKVMLDRDLGVLYGVETKALKQAVKRNLKRFPDDFMFELTQEEFNDWRSQFVTSKSDRKGLRYRPYAFTENGVAMLSSVLNSEQAVGWDVSSKLHYLLIGAGGSRRGHPIITLSMETGTFLNSWN